MAQLGVAPQHFLNFFPLPQAQGSLRPTLGWRLTVGPPARRKFSVTIPGMPGRLFSRKGFQKASILDKRREIGYNSRLRRRGSRPLRGCRRAALWSAARHGGLPLSCRPACWPLEVEMSSDREQARGA